MLKILHPISISELSTDIIGDKDLNKNYTDILTLRVIKHGTKTGTNAAYIYNKKSKSTNSIYYY